MRGVGSLRSLDEAALFGAIECGVAELVGDVIVPKISGGSPLHDVSPGGAVLPRLFDITLGADAVSIDTGATIPADYRAIQLVMLLRSSRAANTIDQINLQFNGDAGANYQSTFLYSTGSGSPLVVGAQETGANGCYLECTAASALSGSFSEIVCTIAGYDSTTYIKTVASALSELKSFTSNNLTIMYLSGAWNSTAAINRIALNSRNSANILAGSRLTVYGLP